MEIMDGGILHCPMRREDSLVAEKCFGKNLKSLKGKAVCKTPNTTMTDFAPLTPHKMSNYREISVCADVMKVN